MVATYCCWTGGAPAALPRSIASCLAQVGGRNSSRPVSIYSSRNQQRLIAKADLTQYAYDRFANDLEQVGRSLGYGPLNLFAGSYGIFEPHRIRIRACRLQACTHTSIS